MPIVTVEAIVNWRGSSGKVAVGIATARPTTATNTDLGHEELRDALDVSQDLAALGDHPRDDPEVVPHEHEVGDRARHLRPRALRDGEARLLERRDVVDAVADHRHVAPGVGQRVHDRPLAVRRDAADGGRGQDRLAQRLRLGRAAPRRPAPAPTRHAGVVSDRARRSPARRPRAP